MARGINPAEDVFRVPGAYAGLILHQRKAVVSIDLRRLDWSLEGQAEVAADRAAVEAQARANPQKSELLTKLLYGQPVVVRRSMLTTPPDSPPWLADSKISVRVRADDLVQPTDEPCDQFATIMG
ncbi:hypothetical protein [Mycobacterium sp.]|uniref:hypothetical protein n=1 Tax=Mycobacterium sp. TaxID=1785 RepID=UPI003F9B0CD1